MPILWMALTILLIMFMDLSLTIILVRKETYFRGSELIALCSDGSSQSKVDIHFTVDTATEYYVPNSCFRPGIEYTKLTHNTGWCPS